MAPNQTLKSHEIKKTLSNEVQALMAAAKTGYSMTLPMAEYSMAKCDLAYLECRAEN